MLLLVWRLEPGLIFLAELPGGLHVEDMQPQAEKPLKLAGFSEC